MPNSGEAGRKKEDRCRKTFIRREMITLCISWRKTGGNGGAGRARWAPVDPVKIGVDGRRDLWYDITWFSAELNDRKQKEYGGEPILIEMLVWLSWQSSSLVMSRSPVRIRPQAPKKQHPRGCCFFCRACPESKFIPPCGGNPATSSKKTAPERVLLFLSGLSGVEVYPPLRGKSGHKLQKNSTMQLTAKLISIITFHSFTFPVKYSTI